MPDTIDFNSFMAFCKRLEGQTLSTLCRGLKFILSSPQDDCLIYTPQSTGKPRATRGHWIERVLIRYAVTGSFHPKDYTDISRNASYHLTLIKLYLEWNIMNDNLMVTCQHCKKELSPDHKGPCPYCGKEGKDFTVLLSASIGLKANAVAVVTSVVRAQVDKDERRLWDKFVAFLKKTIIVDGFETSIGLPKSGITFSLESKGAPIPPKPPEF